LKEKNKMKNKQIDTKKAQKHKRSLGGLACLVFKKLSRVDLLAQARVPETVFFLFQWANYISSISYFFGRKKKPSDALLVGPISDNPRVARNSSYWFFARKLNI
jgi:hypothetical protein